MYNDIEVTSILSLDIGYVHLSEQFWGVSKRDTRCTKTYAIGFVYSPDWTLTISDIQSRISAVSVRGVIRMFDIKAISSLAESLSERNFELFTSFGSYGTAFEALHSFPNGDYYLFSLELDNDSPMYFEVHQDGHDSAMEFESLLTAEDVKRIVLLCEEMRFPHAW